MYERMPRRTKIWWTVGATGVAVVLAAAGYWWTRSDEPAVVNSAGGSVVIEMNATPTPASELQVRTANPNSAQGGIGTGAQADATPMPNFGAKSSASAAAPSPADFKQYEQYKGNASALFGELREGQGAEVAAGSVVTVRYKGWLTTGELFDQSAVEAPFTFTEGEHRVISGWEQGLFGMKVGGKRRLIVPPAVGYGDQAKGPIPASSVLIFDVELVSVK